MVGSRCREKWRLEKKKGPLRSPAAVGEGRKVRELGREMCVLSF